MKIVISPAAKKDLENAIDFYKKQREGFGVIFKNELKNKINNLKLYLPPAHFCIIQFVIGF